MPTPITLLWLDRCLTVSHNEALHAAVRHARQHSQPLLAFYSTHREGWLNSALPEHSTARNNAAQERCRAAFDTQQQLAPLGIELHVTDQPAVQVISELRQYTGVYSVFTDAHADVSKTHKLKAFTRAGINVQCIGSNTLLDNDTRQALPDALIGRFTKFYHQVKHIPVITEALNSSPRFDPMPAKVANVSWPSELTVQTSVGNRANSGVLPITQADLTAWWQEYLWDSAAIAQYKSTRNQPSGRTAFSRLSGALALGTLTPQAIWAQIDAYEQQIQRNASTEWLRYELYWREYFHWVGERRGSALFQAPVLPLSHQQNRHFVTWCAGETGADLVDAGMRELKQTGFISNRIRQLVASYLVQDLGVPWQYGAAWFERQLIDYDVNSNYGNWAYIAGNHPISAEPHRFDIVWQTQQHDPNGLYRARWLS